MASYFQFLLSILPLYWSISHSQTPQKTETLTPTNTNSNGARILTHLSDVQASLNEWQVTVQTQTGWQFLLILDNSWGFDADIYSSISITIDSNSIATGPSTFDWLLYGFTVDNSQYFATLMPMDNHESNHIYPACDTNFISPTQPYGLGDVASLPEFDRSCDIALGCSNWQDMEPTNQPTQNNGFPVTFLIENDPNRNSMKLTLSTGKFNGGFVQECSFISMPTNSGLKLYMGGNDPGQQFNINSFQIQSWSNTKSPTKEPTKSPTNNPTNIPSKTPTNNPTNMPSKTPSKSPSKTPTKAPTPAPSSNPTQSPTPAPTGNPIPAPTYAPTQPPTPAPSNAPTVPPTPAPTGNPTPAPTGNPTPAPSKEPTGAPSPAPTMSPVAAPTPAPTINPSTAPSNAPTQPPTPAPTDNPTPKPTNIPTIAPTNQPSTTPTQYPTNIPSTTPTKFPSTQPTTSPTNNPSITPTKTPTNNPSITPTKFPSTQPTISPTNYPSTHPTSQPTTTPTAVPTGTPSMDPTSFPSYNPTVTPSTTPTNEPTFQPTDNPTTNPTFIPTSKPSSTPTTEPTINAIINTNPKNANLAVTNNSSLDDFILPIAACAAAILLIIIVRCVYTKIKKHKQLNNPQNADEIGFIEVPPTHTNKVGTNLAAVASASPIVAEETENEYIITIHYENKKFKYSLTGDRQPGIDCEYQWNEKTFDELRSTISIQFGIPKSVFTLYEIIDGDHVDIDDIDDIVAGFDSHTDVLQSKRRKTIDIYVQITGGSAEGIDTGVHVNIGSSNCEMSNDVSSTVTPRPTSTKAKGFMVGSMNVDHKLDELMNKLQNMKSDDMVKEKQELLQQEQVFDINFNSNIIGGEIHSDETDESDDDNDNDYYHDIDI